MKYPKLREIVEAAKALVMGPCTIAFPNKPSPAPEGYRGRPTYSEDECVGCGACFNSCPARAITMEDCVESSPPKRTLTVQYDHCIFCQTCELNCITDKGIVLETEYNMVSDNRSDQQMSVEKELVVCDVCGSVITAREHLSWLYNKLGPLASANPTLMLSSFKTLKVAEEAENKPEQREQGDVSRGDRMRILCPVCRAKVSVLI